MYKPTETFQSWAEDDKPREKLVLQGRSALSDSELIAILLGSGTTELSAVGLAHQILTSVQGDLHLLSKLGLKELTQFKGVGPPKLSLSLQPLNSAEGARNLLL